MFRFLEARDARERMDELERFLEFWYGPRSPQYGETQQQLRRFPLPEPLRRFHAFAGRWPPPTPTDSLEFFYSGAGGHHLQPLDYVKQRPDGRLDFFMEYQGDWQGLTLPTEADPPVWIEGSFNDDDEGLEGGDGPRPRIRIACASLSKFLVTHCLLTSIYEDPNAPCSTYARPGSPLFTFVDANPGRVVLIWDCEGCRCPCYQGSVHLMKEGILVHKGMGYYRLGALRPEGIKLLKTLIDGLSLTNG